ncbi:phospholipase D family protein [Alysiella filiformis]|uniref:Phosphatidylserine/phosphatidylglycerophosphate/cardiolipin synthase n=1 Tax=Alysiella filiformis DSM 16848 TaxID=1120981 RepID=A0A286EJT0_9NEIS|nr:phospholipase D family protein [Alysiella filiformis]QMT32506.1 phospholipase D family protein [Alysiella filiformis]UBQ57406.1 phospholipase D family protein [Alysiella filiformis DSM 16848]SOD71069.1 Phosphatidylserine/phosphatidylglycerophosphate/cardiolipin synthase [Alysiella filiformis DSM 16848]
MFRYVILLLACVLSACTSLPDLQQRTPSIYIPTQHAPRLEQVLQLPSVQHTAPPNAHVHILDKAQDAFVARATLIDHADVSLDLRYYIWRDDVSGRLLLQKLWQAAQRGVRVRLLLDDNNTRGMDNILFALNQHDKIEVRLFNPFLNRRWRALGYLSDFPRVNRRMHNKSFTADNRVSIIGGRNVGDEYFHTHAETLFSDMDVLLSGSIVTQISADFDRYWQSNSSYPLESIIKKIPAPQLANALQILQSPPQPKAHLYLNSLKNTDLNQAIAHKNVQHLPAQADLISDDPAKALDRHTSVNIASSLNAALKQPQSEIYLVSPYFVPTQKGTQKIQEWAKQGKNITVFTNSLRATDVAAVHSGYARYRKALLQAGVRLFEFKPDHAVPSNKDKGLTGNSSASLHAKTFIVDRQRVFVGSLNLDPRSARLNTEMGVVIHNAALASQMQRQMQQQAQEVAYRVSLDPHGKPQWQDPQTGKTSHREPEARFWKRTISKILSWLPIERLL